LLTEHIALPNVLLGRRVFTELVQGQLQAEKFTRALDAITREPARFRAACRAVRLQMQIADGQTFEQRMAGLAEDMLTLS